MKIYFTASVQGLSDYEDHYKKIVEMLRSMGHTVIANHILNVSSRSLLHESIEAREKHYQELKRWIASSDLVIAETSHPSTNVGYEVSMAIGREKPVLCLHVKEKTPVLLVGIATDKLRVVEYDLTNLSRNLKMYIEELSETVDTRFNFFIAPKHQNYLDWIAKKKKTPRAVHLRRLLERDMENNKEYQKDLGEVSKKSSKKK